MLKYILMLCFALVFSQSIAQKPIYTDYKPQYEDWSKNYILDKIAYWKDRTVFHFRYMSNESYGIITFNGPKSEDRWVLESTLNSTEIIPEIELRKLYRGDMLVYEVFKEDSYLYYPKFGEGATVEVHFPQIPKHIKEVNFLEGINHRLSRNHFHCLKVKIKHKNDQDLGTIEDTKKRIQRFEEYVKKPKTISFNIFGDKPKADNKPKPNKLSTPSKDGAQAQNGNEKIF